MANPKRLAVSDSTPLILLAKIGKLELIRNVYQKIYVPDAVIDETVTQGKALGISDAYIIEKAVGGWIFRVQVNSLVDDEYRFLETNTRLGIGEKEALKLCKQLDVVFFLTDDREARRVARILNITPIGTCGIVIQTYKQGFIKQKEALKIVDDLVLAGLRIGATVYRRILEELEIFP